LTAAEASLGREDSESAQRALGHFLDQLDRPGWQHEREAPELLQWAAILFGNFDLEMAVQLLSRGIEILRATGQHEDIPFFESNKGLMLIPLGRLQEAVELLARTRRVVVSQVPFKRAIELDMSLGKALIVLADPAGRPLLLEAWQQASTALPVGDETRTQVMLAVADAETETGDLANAIRLLDEFERTPQFRNPELACHAVRARARWHWLTGDCQGARVWFERAVAVVRDAYPERSFPVITAMLNLGQFLWQMGELREAELIGEQASLILAHHPIPTLQYMADYLLANVAEETGDRRFMLERYRNVATGLERELGPEHPFTGLAKIKLAKAIGKTGDPVSGLRLAIDQISLLSRPLDRIAAWDAAGQLHEQAGNRDAIACYERALEAAGDLAEVHPSSLGTRIKLALLHCRAGEFDEAYRHHEIVRQILADAIGPHDSAHILAALAPVAGLCGQPGLALSDLIQSLQCHRVVLPVFLRSSSTHRKRTYLERARLLLDTALRLLFSMNLPIERLAIECVLLFKGRVLDVVRDEWAALRREGGEGVGHLLEEARRLNEKLLQQCFGDSSQPESFSRLIGMREGLQRAISERVTRVVQWDAEISFDDVRSRLASCEEVAVEFVFCKSPHWSESDQPYYAACVFTANAGPNWLPLGASVEIDAAVKSYRSAIDRSDAPQEARLAHELFNRLIAPLHLADARTLFVAPDADLNLLPFGALLDAEGRRLVERYTIAYLSCIRDLTAVDASKADSPAVLFGSPSYDMCVPQKSAEAAANRLEDLPSALDEVMNVAALFPTGGCQTVLRSAATKSAFLGTVRPALLHVATHGRFAEQKFDRSLAYAGEEPMFSSWLAFAGANRTDEPLPDRVTAMEIANMDLQGCRLAVLSACDSGAGAVGAGDGVYSMRRALALAGARTQLVTLWSVNDPYTSDLIFEFYQLLKAGHEVTDALSLVQRRRARSAEPRLWAPFVASGQSGPLSDLFLPR